MKKSNKISVCYIICSLSLLLALIFCGGYGIYISVGLSFMRSTVSNVSGNTGGVRTVSYGSVASFESSMTGVIILSVAILVLAVFDIISLIKQVSLFKQFKIAQTLEEKIGGKKKFKRGLVIGFAVIVDLLSIALGIIGIFVNLKSFESTNITWVLYAVDALISLLALVSLVLLLVKISLKKRQANAGEGAKVNDKANIETKARPKKENGPAVNNFDIDEVEYILIKLKNLKTMKMITPYEYYKMRSKFLNIDVGDFFERDGDMNDSEDSGNLKDLSKSDKN